jgi:mannose-1-phosphate guanylyltransferase
MLLAGGSGTRFWPMSRAKKPKQLLALAGRDPLLTATWKRVRRLAPPERIWVAAPRALVSQVKDLLPDLPGNNLVVEPSPRDTAPAIALASATVARRDPRAILAVFPTDHVIPDVPAFVRSVRAAAATAAEGHLVCLGIRPDRPATGFGYLKCSRQPDGVESVPVERFVEKPDLARARRFVRSGKYLWNGGMFVWQVERFLTELHRTAPRIHRAVNAFVGGNAGSWTRAPRISVDYAVMEKAKGVRVVPLDAGWNDVGSWAAAASLREKAARRDPKHLLVDSDDSVVFGDERIVAVVGVPGVVVVDTPDALLVVKRERSEEVKQVVQSLKKSRRTELL